MAQNPNETVWTIRVAASGAVHDKDGNLISGALPVQEDVVISENEARIIQMAQRGSK